jgi:hypothetical protein
MVFFPHCGNSSKIPHYGNSSKIPHSGNSFKMPHCGNSSKIPHCGNSSKNITQCVILEVFPQCGILKLFPQCGIFCFSFYYKKSLKIPKGGNQNRYIEEEQTTQFMEYLCHKWPRICSTCRKHFLVLSSFMTCHRVCNQSKMTGATSGARTAHSSWAPEFTPGI